MQLTTMTALCYVCHSWRDSTDEGKFFLKLFIGYTIKCYIFALNLNFAAV